MSADVDTDRRAQMAFIRTLVERAISQVEALLRQTDAAEAHSFAPLLVMQIISEILRDRHGADGPAIFLDAAKFAAETIMRGERLTEPKGGAR